MKKRRNTTIVTAIVAVGILLSGCNSNSSEQTTAAAATNAEAATATAETEAQATVKTIIAATEGTTRPLTYIGKDRELTGYEVAVLKAVDELLPEYEIEIKTTEFASIFTGIDSGLYQIGFNNLSKNKEREEKYSFPELSHYDEGPGFFVTKGLTDTHPIEKLEDLGGLRTYANSKGDTWQLFVEDFNEQFPENPIEVQYSDEDWASLYLKLWNGEFDILKGVESRLEMYKDEYGYEFDFVNLPKEDVAKLGGSLHYYIFGKDEEGQALSKAFNDALVQLKADGTLKALSLEHLGKDYTGD